MENLPEKPRRHRRTRQEIEAAGGYKFHCDVPDCGRRYTTTNELKVHTEAGEHGKIRTANDIQRDLMSALVASAAAAATSSFALSSADQEEAKEVVDDDDQFGWEPPPWDSAADQGDVAFSDGLSEHPSLPPVVDPCRAPPPLPPPPPPPAPPTGPPLSPLKWFLHWLPAWTSRHHITATAITELLAAVVLLIGWLTNFINHFRRETERGQAVSQASTAFIYHLNTERESFPKNYDQAAKAVDINVGHFETWAVCPAEHCGAIYPIEQIQRKANPITHCTRFRACHVEMPLQQYQARTTYLEGIAKSFDLEKEESQLPYLKRCATRLVEFQSGKKLLPKDQLDERKEVLSNRPLQVVPYQSLIEQLKQIMKQPGVYEACEAWRDRYNVDLTPPDANDVLKSDIWDGEAWRRYFYLHRETMRPWNPSTDHPDQKFELLAASGTQAFAVNVDWFQADKARTYSVGAIYLTMLNLSREKRYKRENMILIAILPGPKKTSREVLHSVQLLLVKELQQLLQKEGIMMKIANGEEKRIRGFLLCAICDAPARAESCGFMAAGSIVNCAWCMNGSNQKNAISYTKDPTAGTGWRSRTDASHRAGAFDWSDLLWKIRMQEASVTAQRVGTVRPGDPNHLYLPVDALLMSHGVAPPPESDVAPVRMEIDGESDDENHRRRLKDEEERLKLLLLQPLQEEFNEEGETVDHNDRVEEEEEEEEEIGVDAAHRGVEVLDEVKEHEDDQEEYEEEEKSSFIPAPAAAASSGARLRERRVTAPQPSPAPKKVKAAKKVKLPASLVLQHEQKHGSRWSAWHELPYWDSVGGGPADVMHNIFLGITNDLMSMLTTTMKPESKEALRAFVNSEKQSIEHRIKDSKDVEDMTPHEREKLVWDKEYLARLISASDTLAAKDKSVSILSDANMKALQSFMDNCSVPSDIGRILRKFSSKMSGIKAVEWANWATIFAVPALRTLMQQQQQRQQKKKTPNSRSRVSPPTGPPLLLEQHLDLFIRLQKIATILGGYVISKEQIEEVKELLLEYVKSYEQLFGAAAVKPNHHWAQHIPQMLYDYGPPAGWWCQSYERYNGLLAGLPRTPAFIEICIMRRSILMIEVVRKVNILHDTAGDHAGDGIGPTRDHLAFIQHLISGSVETLSSDCDFLVGECADWKLEMNIQRGRKSFMYHLNGKNWIQTYRSLEATMTDIVTFNKITGTEPYLGCLMGSGKEGDLGVSDNLPLWKGGDRFMPLYYTASRLLGLLQWRYAISYEEKITNSRKASADVPSAALFAKMRQHHGLNIDSNLKHLRGVNPLIRREFTVYDTLVKGDVVFGSRINQRRFINSFVMVPFQLEGPAAKIVMGYGQVQFYFTHIFLDQRHQFALVTWWDEAKKHRPHYFSKLCADSFELFPTLNHTADSIREYDLVPVQRIYGRWIPHISKQNNKKVHLALPIPKKNHA